MKTLFAAKFLAALAVTSVLAAPALAQSFDPEAGTGNVLPFAHTASTPKTDRMAVRHDAASAFAFAPGGASAGSYDPSATGGGSTGYNEMLRNY